jgi:DNA polymerase (family X)
VVAECRGDPRRVAESLARAPGVRSAERIAPAAYTLTYVDGLQADVFCTTSERFAVALWVATGSRDHTKEVAELLSRRGFTLGADTISDAAGAELGISDEREIYSAAGLPYLPPELREGRGEVARASGGDVPDLVTYQALRGILHCHSTYSDGNATIGELASAAQERGWSYIGISDHSVSAFYAGGLKPEAVREQHREIDALNAALGASGFLVLKGIEADILADGRIDYDEEILASFDYVIGSVHSRFSMDEETMTARILTALENPYLTVLGHATGRLLLTREPYAVDIAAVLQKAASSGVALELNADPHRLDLDWRHLGDAKELGIAVEIGPDAHSIPGLDNVRVGIDMARKGGLERGDVLNARSADEVLAFARARRP